MLTVVILAKNEAENLKELLPTLKFANEVIVIDDYSSDETANVCRQWGAKRYLFGVNTNFAAARNYGLDQIKKGWVLYLDADERLNPELVEEIKQVIKTGDHIGYAFGREDVFYGKDLHFGDSGGVRLVRLGRVGAGRWAGAVHEVWQIANPGMMRNKLKHYSHESVRQLFKVVREYALIRAKEVVTAGKYANLFEAVIFPPAKLLYLLFVRLGILDGWRGVVMSLAMAYHSWLVRWYAWDLPWKKTLSAKKRAWRYLMVAPILLLPLGQLLRGSFWGIEGIYGHEVLMVIAIIWSFGVMIEERGGNWPKRRYMRVLLALSVVFGLSFGLSVLAGKPLSGGLQLVRWYVYVAYLWCWLWGVHNNLLVSVAGLLNYYGLGLVVGGWGQYLWLPDTRFLALLGWDDHYYRMIGLVLDPNFLGLLLVLVAIWWYFRMSGRARLMGLMLVLGALAATYSRSSWLTMVVVLVMGAAWQRKALRQWYLWGLVGLFGLVVWWLPKPGGEGVNLLREFSLKSRWKSWQEAIEVIKQQPVWGIGFNQYANLTEVAGRCGVEYHPKSPDNSFLFVGATSGIIGLMVFGYLLVWWWRELPAPVYRLSLAAIVIHSLTNNSFFYTFVLLWWWLLLVEYEQLKVSERN